jgi:hypothetical protein
MNSMRFKTCTLIKNIGIRTLCKQSENGKTNYLKISTNYSSYNQTQYNQINKLQNEIKDLEITIEHKEKIIAQIYVDTFNKTNKNNNISDVY